MILFWWAVFLRLCSLAAQAISRCSSGVSVPLRLAFLFFTAPLLLQLPEGG